MCVRFRACVRVCYEGDGDGEQVSVRELVPVCVRFRACVRVCYDEEQVSW